MSKVPLHFLGTLYPIIPFDDYEIGQFATLKGNIFYFHGPNTKLNSLEPVYQLLENGTLVEFMDPFQSAFESNPEIFYFTIKIAPFYERAYKTYQIKTFI